MERILISPDCRRQTHGKAKEMTHKYHSELKTKLGFKFNPGSGCDCKDNYSKQVTPDVSLFIRKEKCHNGKPHRRCKWEIVMIQKNIGQINALNADGDFMSIQNIVQAWTI